MDNRGKLWSIDHDQQLMESPHLSNTYFSQSMGRSENAIKMRRNHLAVKMHQNDPSVSIEECVGLMHGDMEHASILLDEWNEKRASFKSFMDTNRKRKSREQAPPAVPGRSPYFQQLHSTAPTPPLVDLPPWEHTNAHWPTATNEEKIAIVCKSIREEGGNIASVFNDPQFLPTVVQFYPGLEAYARVVQARGSTPMQRCAD